MNVLVLEDNATAFALGEWLAREGHVLLDAATVMEADYHWSARSTVSVDCIILDLNMDATGLSNDLVRASEGGLLSGWLWLESRVLNLEPAMRQRTLVYSAYLDAFRDAVASERYDGIRLVAKQESRPSIRQVKAFVNELPGRREGSDR